jgi:hypothetical protein
LRGPQKQEVYFQILESGIHNPEGLFAGDFPDQQNLAGATLVVYAQL